MTVLLSVRDLHVQYHSTGKVVHAVNGASLEVQPLESWGIIGESGCGKSSLVRALVHLLPVPGRITGGTVEFGGSDVTVARGRRLRELRATGMGFMPQSSFGALNPVVKIERQFSDAISASRKDLALGRHREVAAELLAEAGFADPDRVLDGYPFELSGGMAQRVAMCLVMVRRPRLVIADEPTTGLDLTTLRQIMDMFVSLRANNAQSMVLVTHALEVVAQYCSHVAVMYGGQVVEKGPVGGVFVTPEHPYTQALLASVPSSGHRLLPLEGSVPNLERPPQGCIFQSRCPKQQDPRCVDTRPPLRQVGPDHHAATFCSTASPGAREQVHVSARGSDAERST